MPRVNKKVVPTKKAPWKIPPGVIPPWAWRVKSKRSQVFGYCETETEAKVQAHNTAIKITQFETSAGPQTAFADFKLPGSN